MKATLLLLAVVLLLMGCGTTRTVETTKIVYVYPDMQWLKRVQKVTPPDKAVYEAATVERRYELLGDAYNRQSVSVDTCNAQLETIEKWIVERKALDAKAIQK